MLNWKTKFLVFSLNSAWVLSVDFLALCRQLTSIPRYRF